MDSDAQTASAHHAARIGKRRLPVRLDAAGPDARNAPLCPDAQIAEPIVPVHLVIHVRGSRTTRPRTTRPIILRTIL